MSNYRTYLKEFSPSLITPTLWLDGTDTTKKTSTIDAFGSVVDAITCKDSTALVTSPLSSGALRYKPRYNGDGLYCKGSYGFTLGTTSSFNYLHNSGGFTLYLVFKQLPQADQTNPYPIFRTATASNQVGISISYYNRNGTGNAKTMSIFISNGAGGTAQFLINGSANAITDNEYHILKLKFTGTTLSASIKNENASSFTSIGSDATGSTSGSNATNVMTLSTTAVGWAGYFKHLVAFNSVLSSTNEALMDNWATLEMQKQVTATDINVYISGNAQSNYWGRGANGSASGDLSGTPGGYVWYPVNNAGITVTGQPYWTKLQLGVSSNPDFGETVHGFNNRFGRNLKVTTGEDVAILGYGVSSSRLKNTIGQVDWNASSVESGDLYPKWRDNFTVEAFADMQHVLRKNPILRGLVMMQGETDAVVDGTTYRADQETLIKTMIDRLISLGYDTTKIRAYIFRINDLWSSFDPTALADVRTAQVDVATGAGGTDFSAYIPSKFKSITWSDTDAKAMNGDNLHYSASGCDSMGVDLYNYFITYFNE